MRIGARARSHFDDGCLSGEAHAQKEKNVDHDDDEEEEEKDDVRKVVLASLARSEQ